jgi:rod shape determining protein RodA
MLTFLKEYLDFRLTLVTIALVLLGLVSVYSAAFDARAADVFRKQIAWACVGSVALVLIWTMPFRYFQFISYPAYFLSLAMLLAVLLLGKTVSGSTSWFNLGAFRIQPSEFAKITTTLALGQYLSRPDVSLQEIKHLALASAIVLAPVVLIMLQPDLGTSVIFLGMFFPLLYWGGATQFTLLSAVAPVIAAIAALFGTTPFLVAVIILGTLLFLTREHNIVAAVVFSITVLVGISVQFIYDGLRPYQQKRIATFLDPAADPLGAGYNILQSKVAIGSGGLLGKGFLHGTQTQLNFIPEQWTDFIFCVPGEEFGFLGAVTVFGLCMALLVRSVTIASIMRNKQGSFVAIGLGGIFCSHIVINIGMAVGIMPVIGVPLPFLSYGGSFMIVSMCMVGILLNLYAHRKEY